MTTRSNKARFFLVTIILLLIAVVGYAIAWVNVRYEVNEVSFTDKLDWHFDHNKTGFYTFGEVNNENGIIIYPGAKVDPLAYGFIAESLSNNGYFVVIPTMPVNMAILKIDRADEIMSMYPTVSNWYVGGHSLGGVSAGEYVKKHEEKVKGLFFLGTYPGSDLSDLVLPCLNVYAENDGLTTLSAIEKHKDAYPQNTKHFMIVGGNHAGFGIYGPQAGDKSAIITTEEQQVLIVDQLLNWLQSSMQD